MLKLDLSRLPVPVLVAGAAVVVPAAAMLFGMPLLDAFAGAAVIAGGGAIAALTQRLSARDKQIRQLRFVADRLQAMLQSAPASWCLFTPQGLLREAVRMTALLGTEKIAHFDDIAAALKNDPEFVGDFRRLQQTGQGFARPVETTGGKKLRASGERFRIGREGPPVDILWFLEGAAPAAEEAVADAAVEQRVRTAEALLNAMPFPLWLRAATGDLPLLLCNEAYAKALDASPEKAMHDQLELASPTARAGSGRTLTANVIASGAPQSERRHVIIAGQRRLLEITEAPYRSKEGGIDAVLGFAVDVTAEEEKGAELERHLSAHHDVLEHLGSGIAIYGPDMRLEFHNRAYQRLWDTDEKFLRGNPSFGEVLEDLRARRRAPEQADFQRYKKERLALFTSLIEPREDLMHLPDGTSLRILAVPHPFGGIMFVHEDVTDKLALESSYNTLIAVQRETLDNLAEGIAVFGSDGKLRLFNPAFARIWKLPHDYLESAPHVGDLIERMKPLLTYGDNWSEFKGEMVGYALDRSARKGRIERADQAVIEYVTVPLPDGAVLNSYLDATDSARVEQALRASNAALATADRLKSEFVANVSYQLRTPLNTIMGFSEILTNQYFGTLNDRQLDYTRTIMDASKRLLLLINDVLDLATIEAGRMALNRRTIDVADLLNAAKQVSAEWARQQSLEIVIDCPSGIEPFEADEHRMKQVLFNLISNAIKFTPAGGRITLEARRQDGWMVLSVIDTGIGIPEQDRERVFGKFERTNAQARQGGAGLGLSLVKSFVELHGGRLEIDSQVNKGTRISCFLPLKAEDGFVPMADDHLESREK